MVAWIKSKLNSTIVLALIFLVANTLYLIEAMRTAPPFEDGEVSVTLFPIVIVAIIYVAAGFVLVDGLKEQRWLQFQWRVYRYPIMTLLLSTGYVFIFKRLGFLISTTLFVFVMILLFEDKNKSVVRSAIRSVVITILVYIMFDKIFGVRLPKVVL